MSSVDLLPVVEMDWKAKVVNWSHLHFKLNDILLDLVKDLLEQFPTIQEFELNSEMILQILIDNLPPEKAEKWKKSEENVGVHGKEDVDNYVKDRKNIKQMLGRQMDKLEHQMFAVPIIESIIESDDVNDCEIIEIEETETFSASTGTKRKATSTYKRRTGKNYGKKMIGRKVCKFFPRLKGSTHKAMYYDGEIVDYNEKYVLLTSIL
jgi:hypothetical protein